MANGALDKWREDGYPGDRTRDAAGQLIRHRLDTVGSALARAADRDAEDADAVHALRVATRRAAAALRLFDDFLPRRQADRWVRRMKRIRRTLGPARDADVLTERLAPDPSAAASILDDVRRMRQKTRKAFRKLVRVVNEKSWFGQRQENLLDGVRRRSRGNRDRFGPWAETQLDRTVRRFRRAFPRDDDDRSLHAFRIRTKELRYTLELLAAALPPGPTDVAYQAVCDLQQDLGVINDRVTGLDMLRDLLRSTDDPVVFDHIRSILNREKALLTQARSAFVGQWKDGREWAVRDSLDQLTGTGPYDRASKIDGTLLCV